MFCVFYLKEEHGVFNPGFYKVFLKVECDVSVQFIDAQAKLHPNAELITGTICGYKIQEIQTPLTKQVRYLDKLVDELAKGRKMEKILRQS